jgi:hypothetical protein
MTPRLSACTVLFAAAATALFVSAPAKGNRGMHTVMAVAKFNHEKRARVVASTASTANKTNVQCYYRNYQY